MSKEEFQKGKVAGYKMAIITKILERLQMSKEEFQKGKVAGYKMAIMLIQMLEDNIDGLEYRGLKNFLIGSQDIVLSGINYNSEDEEYDH